MVNKELYKAKVKEFCNLVNTSDLSTKPTAQAIWERIYDKFTDDDMIKAFDDMTEAEVTKLTYPVVLRYLRKHKDVRIHVQQQKDKARIRSDIETALLTHQEISDMVQAVLQKRNDEGAVKRPPVIKPNSVIVRRDGTRVSAWIDHDDNNMIIGKVLTLNYEERGGGHMVRSLTIDLKQVKHMIFTGRTAIGEPGRAQERLALPVDDDFIPELEVPDNAFQGSLGLDRQTGSNT